MIEKLKCKICGKYYKDYHFHTTIVYTTTSSNIVEVNYNGH